MNLAHTPPILIAAACALAALLLLLLTLPALTRGARERARAKARAWAALRAPEWEARAQKRAQARASGKHAEARLRGALMIAVGMVALAATNLSAHGTITAMHRVGLHNIDTAISALVVFEGFLAILGALSWWHRKNEGGFNRYEFGIWLLAALMGWIAWWGGENIIYALWPLLAAIAWHVVITFGRDAAASPLTRWWRLKRGRATSQDASAVDTERRITSISNHGYAANNGPRVLRAIRERLFDRAWARADELGILSDEVCARIQARVAARYEGVRALAPDAVAHMNPWQRMRAPMRAHERTGTRAPSTDARALDDERAPASAHSEDERASATSAHSARSSAHEDEERAHSAPSAHDVPSMIAEHFAGPSHAMVWTQEFWQTNGRLPTGDDLATVFEKTAGNCRKWLTPVRRAMASG